MKDYKTNIQTDSCWRTNDDLHLLLWVYLENSLRSKLRHLNWGSSIAAEIIHNPRTINDK